MDSNEFYDYEDRRYVNPTLSSGEQEQFINNFRDVQNRNNQQIAEQTYNLGKALPSNLGGLGGGEAYFEDRYQTNQIDDMVANLNAAAKAQTLSDVMTNYKSQLQARYNKAYKNYQARQRAKNNSGNGGNTGGNPVNDDDIYDYIEVEDSGISQESGNITPGSITSVTVPGAEVTTTVGTLSGGTETYADGTRVYENGKKAKQRIKKTRPVAKYDPVSGMTFWDTEEYYVYE